MSFPRYPAYKDSGVAWLGEVPAHWEVSRIKNALVDARNGVWGDEPSEDNSILCVRVADFNRQDFTVSLDNRTYRGIAAKEREGRLLQRNDLLLEKSGGGENQPVGFVVIYEHDELAVCSNFVARLSLKPSSHPRYLLYCFAKLYSERVNVRSIKQNTGIQNLDAGQYFDEPIVFPPLAEQRAIAAFLDAETARIDALVAKQEALIAALQEKRRALISHAVTKGLDPAAPLKDSGVPWLGAVPAHWEVKRLKHCLKSFDQGWSPQCENRPAEAHEWGVLKAGCVNSTQFNAQENKALPSDLEPVEEYIIKQGDILVSRANTRELVGSAAVVPQDYPYLMLCDKLYRLRVRIDECVPEFVTLLLRTPIARGQIEIEATGASQSMQNIAQDTIRNLAFAFPPVVEQSLILERIREETAQIDTLIAKAQEFIALLREHRTALIAAAVTGQIDVRGGEAR